MASEMECTVKPELDCVLDLSCTTGDNPEVTNPIDNQTKPTRNSRKRKRVEEEDNESETKRLLANSQERVRMQRLNEALEQLKNVLPPHFHAYQKRMSKIRTLRLAMNYIATLSDLIEKDNARREAAYRQTLQYIQEHGHIPQFSPDGVLVSSIQPPIPDQVPMTPIFHTPGFATPYHAYHNTLHGFTDNSSYETPVQTPPRHRPRQLNFYSMPRQTQTSSTEVIVAGSTGVPVKNERCKFAQMDTENVLSNLRKFPKTETFTSPLLGSRNQNELDISFLSTGSDTTRDDGGEPVRLTSLEDIIDEDNEDDPSHGPATLG